LTADHTAYYRHLAETVLRAEQHPTSPNDKTFSFLDYGLTYGPSEQWPETLIEGWAAGQIRMPDEDHWPSEEGMTELFDACRQYLEETGEEPPATLLCPRCGCAPCYRRTAHVVKTEVGADWEGKIVTGRTRHTGKMLPGFPVTYECRGGHTWAAPEE